MYYEIKMPSHHLHFYNKCFFVLSIDSSNKNPPTCLRSVQATQSYTTAHDAHCALLQRNARYPRWRSYQLFLYSYTAVIGFLVCVCSCVCVEVLTLSHSIKGLNEGFDSSSGFWIGISADVYGCGRDHGDAAPVTAVIGVGHPHLITLGPNRQNEQGCCVETIQTPGEGLKSELRMSIYYGQLQIARSRFGAAKSSGQCLSFALVNIEL